MGTLVCHYQHQVDNDPLVQVGLKDITAHVNFTGTAVAAQDAGFEVLGYTNQAHFLINCGLAPKLDAAGIKARSMASKLVMEHEMGELFKVIGLSRAWSPGCRWALCRATARTDCDRTMDARPMAMNPPLSRWLLSVGVDALLLALLWWEHLYPRSEAFELGPCWCWSSP